MFAVVMFVAAAPVVVFVVERVLVVVVVDEEEEDEPQLVVAGLLMFEFELPLFVLWGDVELEEFMLFGLELVAFRDLVSIDLFGV